MDAVARCVPCADPPLSWATNAVPTFVESRDFGGRGGGEEGEEGGQVVPGLCVDSDHRSQSVGGHIDQVTGVRQCSGAGGQA